MPHFPYSFHLTAQQQATAATVGVLAVTGIVLLAMRRSRPTSEAIEKARRERLSVRGRLTDGSLVDTTTLDGSFLGEVAPFTPDGKTPQLLLFRYRIAGVAYEAVQDVSALPEQVRDLRIDLPIQVRYDYQNPADSIVVSEDWSGLRCSPLTDTDQDRHSSGTQWSSQDV